MLGISCSQLRDHSKDARIIHSCFVSFPFPNSSSKPRNQSKNSFQAENFLDVQVDQTACPWVGSSERFTHFVWSGEDETPGKFIKKHPQIQRLEFPWWQIFQTSAPQHPADLQDAHDAVQFSLDEGKAFGAGGATTWFGVAIRKNHCDPRALTCPTNGKGNSSSQLPLDGIC